MKSGPSFLALQADIEHRKWCEDPELRIVVVVVVVASCYIVLLIVSVFEAVAFLYAVNTEHLFEVMAVFEVYAVMRQLKCYH